MVTAINFLGKLVDSFDQSPDQDHFGVVTFNKKAYTEFTFQDVDNENEAQVKERISRISKALAYQTRTDLGMKAARDNLFSPQGGDRPDKPNIMIFLTDGKPTNQPRPFAEFAAEFHKDPKVLNKLIVPCFKELNII